MLEVEFKGNVAIIDIRERILKGEHPKREIIEFVKEAKQGTIIEIHLPHRAEPLSAALESIGISAIINAITPEHYRMMCVKL
jgi:hypothetical protein